MIKIDHLRIATADFNTRSNEIEFFLHGEDEAGGRVSIFEKATEEEVATIRGIMRKVATRVGASLYEN